MKSISIIFTKLILILFVTNILYIHLIKSELYTAISDLSDVIQTAKELPNLVDEYIKAEESRLNLIKSFSERLLNGGKVNMENAEDYLGNPINVFHLIKRLTFEWPKIERSMKQSSFLKTMDDYLESGGNFQMPDEEDMKGIAKGLNRLQTTYHLPLVNLSRGEFASGLKAMKQLTASDFLAVAEQLIQSDERQDAVLWLEYCLEIEKNETKKSVNRRDVLETVAFNYFFLSNYSKAVEYSKELIQIDTSSGSLYDTYKHYLDTEPVTNKPEDDEETAFVRKFYSKYHQLCRNEKFMNPKIEAKLKCYYSSRKSSYLILQPIKTEEVFPDPEFVIFHDILYDHDIEYIKQASRFLLKRAEVDKNNEEGLISEGRIGKSTWLQNIEHPKLESVSNRLQEITGLNMTNSEPFQVLNYGIGGHYDPHVDFEKDEKGAFFEDSGRRIATLLFYISDVIAGGATVFPSLNVTIWPRKGSAAFWYNLDPSGKGNYLTRHAACPVLAGDKWVVNVWIHEYHQEFRRPCGLKETFVPTN